MKISLMTAAGVETYDSGALTREQCMAIRAIQLEHPDAQFHTPRPPGP